MIGLFLVKQTERAAVRDAARLVGPKLVALPLLTLLKGRFVTMPTSWFACSLVWAALPTGPGPVMLAKLYDHKAATSRAILVSTVLSVATVSALVLCLGR